MNAEKLFKWRVRGRRLEEVVLGLETKDGGNIEVERWMLSTTIHAASLVPVTSFPLLSAGWPEGMLADPVLGH